MIEFLHYQIFGLISVQTYLIVAVVMAILIGAFNKKGFNMFQIVCKGLLWPLTVVALGVILICAIIIGLIQILSKGRR